jgi:hypothetical protein
MHLLTLATNVCGSWQLMHASCAVGWGFAASAWQEAHVAIA